MLKTYVINFSYIMLDWIGFSLEQIGSFGSSLRTKAMEHFGMDYWIDNSERN